MPEWSAYVTNAKYDDTMFGVVCQSPLSGKALCSMNSTSPLPVHSERVSCLGEMFWDGPVTKRRGGDTHYMAFYLGDERFALGGAPPCSAKWAHIYLYIYICVYIKLHVNLSNIL